MGEKINFSGESQRIDQWLATEFSYSRSFFHHIIARGGVLVNGKVAKKSYKLKNNDEIVIDDLERYLSTELLEESPNIPLPVVLEKDDYLVINKAKGILSHPNSIRDIASPSVVGFLYHRYKNLPSIGNFIRAGIVHRLDKDTDGLMIIAKTEKGLAWFKSLFQKKSEAKSLEEKENVALKKQYLATCELSPKGRLFLEKVSEAFANNESFYIKEKVIPKVPHPVIKEGITKILDFTFHQQKNTVEILVEILTGRTHQIRYHLSEHGLPVVADYLYGKEENFPMQLTACQLSFVDPEGENIVLKI